jgi:hypothetical protein
MTSDMAKMQLGSNIEPQVSFHLLMDTSADGSVAEGDNTDPDIKMQVQRHANTEYADHKYSSWIVAALYGMLH